MYGNKNSGNAKMKWTTKLIIFVVTAVIIALSIWLAVLGAKVNKLDKTD